MSDKKPDSSTITTDVLLADLMLRVTTMEKVLVDKGIINKKEFQEVMGEIAEAATKAVMEKAKSSTNLDDFLSKLELTAEEKKIINN